MTEILIRKQEKYMTNILILIINIPNIKLARVTNHPLLIEQASNLFLKT